MKDNAIIKITGAARITKGKNEDVGKGEKVGLIRNKAATNAKDNKKTMVRTFTWPFLLGIFSISTLKSNLMVALIKSELIYFLFLRFLILPGNIYIYNNMDKAHPHLFLDGFDLKLYP